MKKEKQKDKIVLFAFVFLFLIISAGFVFAAEPDYYVQKFISFSESTYGPFFAALFGVDNFDEFLFSKVLVFFLLFSVVFMILSRASLFRTSKSISTIISLIVSILAVRGMSYISFFDGILIPYTALGGAITIFLPLLIYFLFVHTSVPGSFGRRFAWFIYGLIFFVVFIMRLGDVDMGTSVKWIYWVGILFVIACMIFDRTIHYYFDYAAFSRGAHVMDAKLQAMLMHDYYRFRDLYSRTGVTKWEIEAADVARRLRRMGYTGRL